MPVQPQDTSTDKLKKSGPDVFAGKDRKKNQDHADLEPGEDVDANIKSEPNQANYGFSGHAELDTEAEETEEQEYQADGLPRTNKYSVDNTARGTKEQSERRGRSDSGC